MGVTMSLPTHLKILFLAFSAVFLGSCSSRAIHEAEAVVAQADSLWQEGKMYGIDEGDSATLAQAYETLQKHSVFSSQFSEVFPFVQRTSFLRTYAHACYHYGRLLRAKDDPENAMRCFINATHTRTPDNHILGRVYSNIGDMCHLAGEYRLSYEMFEKSANMFLQDGDTLSYYYCLNDMAYELAEQGKKEETMALLNTIPVIDEDLSSLTNFTKAELYMKIGHYDSAIYYAHSARISEISSIGASLILAQSYSFLEIEDSAVYYANFIIGHSNSLSSINNALYILSNDDKTKDIDAVRQASADRSDTQKLITIRQGKLSQAVQLLEQDLAKTPDLRWLYAVIVTIIVIGSCLSLYVRKKRNQHKLLSQQVDDLNKINDSVKQRHEHIQKEYTEYKDNLLTQIEQNYAVLTQSPNIFTDIHWKDYNALCQIINDNFGMLAAKLQGIYHLSEKEIRLCILVLLEITNSKLMAEKLYYSESGIRNLKNRTAKKLGTNSVKMRNALLKLAISEYSNAANNEIVHA